MNRFLDWMERHLVAVFVATVVLSLGLLILDVLEILGITDVL